MVSEQQINEEGELGKRSSKRREEEAEEEAEEEKKKKKKRENKIDNWFFTPSQTRRSHRGRHERYPKK